MADAEKPPQESATSKADAMALIAEAEAEAAEAEALAAAARARARAARLRREALAHDEAETETETVESTPGAPDADADAADTVEATTDEDVADGVEATEADTETETETAEAVTAEDTDSETTEVDESQAEPSGSRRRLRLPSLSVIWKAAAIILICVFVAASGYMVWQRRETSEHNQRVANFIAGAKQGVINMTSLDFNKAKEDVQRVIDSSTGQFRDDFQQRAKDFTTVVEQSKVVTEGTVNAAAVQSIDGNSALVLVAATSRITNAAGAKDEPRRWRLRVTVTEDGGQYKMSKMEFIP